jgi:hypothetical protein
MTLPMWSALPFVTDSLNLRHRRSIDVILSANRNFSEVYSFTSLCLVPAGQPTSRYLGEMLGTTAILLFSCSLVIAMKAPLLGVLRTLRSLALGVLQHRLNLRPS